MSLTEPLPRSLLHGAQALPELSEPRLLGAEAALKPVSVSETPGCPCPRSPELHPAVRGGAARGRDRGSFPARAPREQKPGFHPAQESAAVSSPPAGRRQEGAAPTAPWVSTSPGPRPSQCKPGPGVRFWALMSSGRPTACTPYLPEAQSLETGPLCRTAEREPKSQQVPSLLAPPLCPAARAAHGSCQFPSEPLFKLCPPGGPLPSPPDQPSLPCSDPAHGPSPQGLPGAPGQARSGARCATA